MYIYIAGAVVAIILIKVAGQGGTKEYLKYKENEFDAEDEKNLYNQGE